MKKTISLLLFLTSFVFSLGAEISGTAKIDPEYLKNLGKKVQNIGILIFVEENGIYDITDSEGNFKLDNLDKGKEYTLVFQKSGISDYKERVKVKSEIQSVNILIKPKIAFARTSGTGGEKKIVEYKEQKKYLVKGKIISKSDKDIFINFRNKGYGIIAKPNEFFETELEPGEYAAEVLQDDTYLKNIRFKVTTNNNNNLGVIEMEKVVPGVLNVQLEPDTPESYLYLYLDNELRFSQKIAKGTEHIRIPDLKQGVYKVVVKTQGYKEFSNAVFLRDEFLLKVVLDRTFEVDNKIYVSILPEDIDTKLELYDDAGTLVTKVPSAKGIYVFDNLDFKKKYRIEGHATAYKDFSQNEIVPGRRVDIIFQKDSDFIFVSGTVYPFSANTKIEVLGLNKSSTHSDENGNYELKINAVKGKKIIKVSSDGYEDKYVDINVEQGKDITNLNIALKPMLSSIIGSVTLKDAKSNDGVMVVIEGLNIWTITEKNGSFSFPNLKEGDYTLLFKKYGYTSKKEVIKIVKDVPKEISQELVPFATMVLRANLEGYEVVINDVKETVKEKVYTKETNLEKKKIIASKKGYKSYKTFIDLTQPGELKEVNISFKDLYEYKLDILNQLEEVKKMIERLKLEEAERKLYEISRLEYIDNYTKEYKQVEEQLKEAKKRLYDSDNAIREKLKTIKNSIKDAEEKDINFTRKREVLDQKYKEAIDLTEKILNDYPTTSLKGDIYKLQGDVYMKMGMTNSASNSYENSKKYDVK